MYGIIDGIQRGIINSVVQQGAVLNLTPEYKAVLAKMKLANAVPTSTDQAIQNKLMKGLIDNGLFTKAEILDMYATQTGGSAINWKNPGTLDPVPMNSPSHTAYKGYKGASVGAKYVKTSFNPAVNGAQISKDNMCWVVGIDNSVAEDKYDFGAYDGTAYNLLMPLTGAGTTSEFRAASSGAANPLTNSGAKYFYMSRNNSANVILGHNGYKETFPLASTGLTGRELLACAWNNNGSVTYGSANRIVRFVFVFSFLSSYELGILVDLLDDYFSNYNGKLINNTVAEIVKGTKQQIHLSTYVPDNDEVIHPSVLRLNEPWNGYTYWQANTPYPLLNGLYELPCIWASNDGINWVVPQGLTNPIFPYDGVTHHYSDNDLYFENGVMYMFYRYDTGTSVIRCVQSTDGITWTTASPVVVYAPAITAFSPSLVKVGSTYYMYYKNYNDGKCYRVSCATITGTYSTPEEVKWNAASLNTALGVQHLSAFYRDGVYYFSVGNAKGVYVGKSTDGINFTGDVKACPTIYATQPWENMQYTSEHYRPDLVEIGGELWVYYSVIANSSGGSSNGSYMGRAKIKIL